MWGPCLLTQVGEALRGLPRSSYFIISKIPSGLDGTVAAEALELALLHLGARSRPLAKQALSD